MNVTDWKAQEDIYSVAEKTFGKTVDIVIMVAGILDSSNLVKDVENGNIFRVCKFVLIFFSKMAII